MDVAIADMFLKVDGVTGECSDADHKGEIDVVSWSWAMDAPVSVTTGAASGMVSVGELYVVKRVDQSSPTLMRFLRNRKAVSSAQLVVRKAGTTPLEYFTIELQNVRINGLKAESHESDLIEHLRLGFSKVKVSYTPQGATGARGGGANQFETDAHLGEGS
jgi:type VI secretion system secreted protein Hcp